MNGYTEEKKESGSDEKEEVEEQEKDGWAMEHLQPGSGQRRQSESGERLLLCTTTRSLFTLSYSLVSWTGYSQRRCAHDSS